MFSGIGALATVELTLYTDALIVRGLIQTRQRRVSDILNQREEPYLVLEDVSVDEFGSRGQPIRAEFAQVNLDAVLFAVGDTPVEPLPELRTPKTREEALVSIPPFSVVGTIHLPPSGGSLRDALSELTGRFIPVTEAMFWSDRVGEPRQTALLVAVNHARAQILAPHRAVDPWEGLNASRPEESGRAG
jgi:hypothetical protein